LREGDPSHISRPAAQAHQERGVPPSVRAALRAAPSLRASLRPLQLGEECVGGPGQRVLVAFGESVDLPRQGARKPRKPVRERHFPHPITGDPGRFRRRPAARQKPIAAAGPGVAGLGACMSSAPRPRHGGMLTRAAPGVGDAERDCGTALVRSACNRGGDRRGGAT